MRPIKPDRRRVRLSAEDEGYQFLPPRLQAVARLHPARIVGRWRIKRGKGIVRDHQPGESFLDGTWRIDRVERWELTARWQRRVARLLETRHGAILDRIAQRRRISICRES